MLFQVLEEWFVRLIIPKQSRCQNLVLDHTLTEKQKHKAIFHSGKTYDVVSNQDYPRCVISLERHTADRATFYKCSCGIHTFHTFTPLAAKNEDTERRFLQIS